MRTCSPLPRRDRCHPDSGKSCSTLFPFFSSPLLTTRIATESMRERDYRRKALQTHLRLRGSLARAYRDRFIGKVFAFLENRIGIGFDPLRFAKPSLPLHSRESEESRRTSWKVINEPFRVRRGVTRARTIALPFKRVIAHEPLRTSSRV